MSEEIKVKKSLKNEERCMHITEKGERCKNKKETESEHCHIHSVNPKKVLTKKGSPQKEEVSPAVKTKKLVKKEKN
jgi:hypothetical protein